MKRYFTTLALLLITLLTSATHSLQAFDSASPQTQYDSPAPSGFGEISKATGRPKTVPVKGYYRKDGTYVKPHYRSPPKSK